MRWGMIPRFQPLGIRGGKPQNEQTFSGWPPGTDLRLGANEGDRSTRLMSAFSASSQFKEKPRLPKRTDPQWIYVANTGSVVRFAYRNGDLKARGKAEVIVRDLPHARGRSVQCGHITRDIAHRTETAWYGVSPIAAAHRTRSCPARSRWPSEKSRSFWVGFGGVLMLRRGRGEPQTRPNTFGARCANLY
jgi:hypothetical protein